MSARSRSRRSERCATQSWTRAIWLTPTPHRAPSAAQLREQAMTQIGGYIEATRRPGVLGVHSLDHFSMTVPDLEKARTFYESFGLDARREGHGIALYTHGHGHRWGLLSEGPRKQLHYLSFGAFEDDLPRFRDHLVALNVERLPPPAGFESNGLW